MADKRWDGRSDKTLNGRKLEKVAEGGKKKEGKREEEEWVKTCSMNVDEDGKK